MLTLDRLTPLDHFLFVSLLCFELLIKELLPSIPSVPNILPLEKSPRLTAQSKGETRTRSDRVGSIDQGLTQVLRPKRAVHLKPLQVNSDQSRNVPSCDISRISWFAIINSPSLSYINLRIVLGHLATVVPSSYKSRTDTKTTILFI